MPSKPVTSPPLQPKKDHGVVRDDEPIDDYENTVRSKEQQEAESDSPTNPPNVAAARRVNAPMAPHETHKGNTGSRNRSKTGH